MYFDNRKQDEKPTTVGEKITVVVIFGFFILLMSLEILQNYEPRKLSVLFFLLFWGPLLLIHELGHAIMARLLGWEVKAIVIGVGKILLHRQWFSAPVEIRSLPIEGFVRIAPKTIKGARIKHALIYFAGPGIELLCVLLITLYLGGFTELFTITDDYGRIAFQSFAFAALMGAVLNLIPQGVITQDGQTPNDGMGILLCLLSNDSDYEQWVSESKAENEAAF